MKKIIALLLCLVLTLPCLTALGEEDLSLTPEELAVFCEELLAEAIARGPVPAREAEEGGCAFDYGDFCVYSPDSALTETSPVTLAEVRAYGDMRGISKGSSLEALLTAYPLDNENLRGTWEEATLYISGLLPESVHTAHALRTGSHVLVLEHTVYATEGETARVSSAVYILEANHVMAVRLLPQRVEMSLEEAQAEIDALADLQEQDGYAMYRAAAPEVMAREDLTFGPEIDFLSAQPEDLTAALGQAESDTWEQDGAEYLRVLQWAGAQAIFHYDDQRKNPTLQLLQVYGDALEGPRGVRVEDTLDSVLDRFPHDSEVGVLYGDGEHAPYGRCDLREDGAYLVYAAETESGPVLLTMTILYDRVADITCTY